MNFFERKTGSPEKSTFLRDKDGTILLYSIQDVTINNVGTAENIDQTICIMRPPTTKYHSIKSTTLYVPSSELGLPQPLSRKQVCPPLNQRVGGHTRLRLGGGWVPIPTTGEKAKHSAYSVPTTIRLIIMDVIKI